ncbi:MAG TPA: universal stress protein [Dehalococcoidia bacterium]|nr:universal stress protein [Dehalococcoidia bacterium]
MPEPVIVVPVDGSELSERAIPVAVALARGLSATLHLLTVWEPEDHDLERHFPALASDLAKAAEKYYGDYLARVAGKAEGVPVVAEVRSGRPAEQILAYAAEKGARFVVMSTHGRSGLSRWWYGSVADRIVHTSSTPVVVVGPNALRDAAYAIRHIATPLDGSTLSESAIPTAVELAAALRARLTLVRAVRWAAQAYPYTLPEAYVPQLDAELEAGAQAYLQAVRGGVETSVTIDTAVVRGAIAESLMEFCEREGVDLVVMSTHGRSGLARATLGSVADRLLHGPCPVALIRPKE